MERVTILSFNISDWTLTYSRISRQETIPAQITSNTEIILNGENVTVEEIQHIITHARAEVNIEIDRTVQTNTAILTRIEISMR